MNLQTIKSFRDEVEKIAARRGLKEIRNLLAAGKGQAASALARTPGVLKPTAAGSQIRQLGQGAEGAATLVAHPQHGVSVRKLYDPAGMSTPEMIARKEQAGKAIGANPHVAQFHGAAQAPGGSTMHFNEFVPGSAPGSKQFKGTPGVRGMGTPEHAGARQAAAGAQKALRGAGFSGGKDIRMGNMIRTPEGQTKVIDYLPTHRGEFMSGNAATRMSGNAGTIIPKTEQASSLLRTGPTNTPTPALMRSQLNAPGRAVRPMKAPKTMGAPGGNSSTYVKPQPKPLAPTDRTPVLPMQG